MRVYVRAKFDVSSIILKSFRQRRVVLLLPTSKGTPNKPTQIRFKRCAANFKTNFLAFNVTYGQQSFLNLEIANLSKKNYLASLLIATSKMEHFANCS